MKLINSLLLLGAFGVVVSVFPSTASAQAEPGVEANVRRFANGRNPLAAEYQVRVYRVQNVRASVMAWWLDQVHNQMPVEFGDFEAWKAQMGIKAYSEADQMVARNEFQQRFPGLQAVTPQDEQNQLLVVGTPESFAKVEAELAVLDKPLKQVEVAAQFVETDPENIRELGLRLMSFDTEGAAPKPPGMGFAKAGPELQEKLNALVAAGKAKVISAPRVTLIDNVYGFIGTGNTIPATVGIKDENGQFHELGTKPLGVNNPQLSVGIQSNFLAKAKVNKDDTISIDVEPSRSINLSAALQQIPLRTIERRQAGFNIRDGDSFALNGVTYAGSLLDAVDGVKAKNVILIVTARIIRRAGDE